jgi:hypothetical protein
LTLPTSDSLSGTTSFIELRSLSTANDELEELVEDEELLEPVAPAAAPPVPEEEPVPEELSLPLDALLVPPPETVSPTSPPSETIVPFSGAVRRVSATASSSLLTVSRSLRTAAFAEAMFASRVAVLMLALVFEEPDAEAPDAALLSWGAAAVEVLEEPDDERLVPVFVLLRFAACVVPDCSFDSLEPPLPATAGVSAGVVAGEVVVVVGVLVAGVLVIVSGGSVVATATALALGVAPVAAVRASAIEAVEAVVAFAPDAPEPEELVPWLEDSPSVSSSRARSASADCKLALACSSVTSALCGSSVASNCPSVTRCP